MTELSHVRWILGGTGTGKSTLARLLAERHGVAVYDGDRAEHAWVVRATAERHPVWAAMRARPAGPAAAPAATAADLVARLHRTAPEALDLLGEDLATATPPRTTVVDYFGIRPADLGPRLADPDHAVFLFPTPDFRRRVLVARYADPARARATWGDRDPAAMLARRLERDALWDAELRAQADAGGLAVVEVDGSLPAVELAGRLAERFGLRA